MKKIIALLSGLPLLWCGSTTAQEVELPNLGAVELYLCNYNDGEDSRDLDRVVDKWNKWADKNSTVPYSAWTLTPQFNAPGYTFDVAWLGGYEDGAGLGASTQEWQDKGGELQGEFDKVLSCPEHTAVTTLNFKEPHAGWPTPTAVTAFSDCTVAEGKRVEDIQEVHRAWAAHLTEKGSKAGMWAFFPAYGGDNDFDYKIVTTYPDYIEMGKDNNDYTNGGGWMKARELTEGVVTCDTPRVYNTVLRRDGGINPQ